MIDGRLQRALGDPTLQIHTFVHWGSQNPQHKELIYSALDQKTGKGIFSSISHAPGLGGFALSARAVGFDIEQTDRATEAVVARISQPGELEGAPSPAALWTAKEAAFKALRSFSPPVTVSQIEIQFEKNDARFNVSI